MFLVTTIVLGVIIALLCASARKAKLHVRHRYLHIRYVVATLIFSIVGAVLFSKILSLINTVFAIPVVRKVLYALIPSANVPAGIFLLIALLSCVILMAAYALMMHLLKAIWLKPLSERDYLNTRNFIEKFFNWLSELFYSVPDDRIILPPAKANVGQWFRVMRIVFAVLLGVETVFFGLCLHFGFTFINNDVMVTLIKSTYMIPVLSYILLEQVELYFAADHKLKESLTDTESIGISVHSNYTPLVDVYKANFEGGALMHHYTGAGEQAIQQELFRGVQKRQRERVKDAALLDSLCRCIGNVEAQSSHYINGLIDLINGEHVAVYDALWGDFDFYYLAYVQHLLTTDKTALVLCDTPSEVDLMKRRLKTVFKRLNSVASLWRIRDAKTIAEGNADILVCTEEQFLAITMEATCPTFYNRLGIVIVLDSYGLVCREEAYFSRVFDRFNQKQVQFVFYLPENNTDIRNELQERLDNKHISLCENSSVNENANILLWRSESVFKPQLALSKRLYHDFGVAYTIAAIAAGANIPHINVLAPESVPVDTYHDLVTKEYNEVLKTDFYKNRAINLSSIVHRNDYTLTDVSPAFNIVFDENKNLLNPVKTWLSYTGVDSSILNIVSPPYMLRDFLADKLQTMLAQSTGIQLLVPKNSLNLRSPAVAMLIKLRKGLPFGDVMKFAEMYSLSENRLEAVLQRILDAAFDEHHYSVYDCFSFAESTTPVFSDQYHYEQTVTLMNEDLYYEACKMTERFVRLDGVCHDVIPVHKNDVYNRYLPRQCAVFGKRRYLIKDINNGVLQLEAEDTVSAELSYRSIYAITDYVVKAEHTKQSIIAEKFSAETCEAAITREISAYLAYPGVLNFQKPLLTTKVDLPQPIVETKTVPCLHLTLHNGTGRCSNKIANTLCRLIEGALESFLPQNYKDLLVFSKLDTAAVCCGVEFDEVSDFLPDPIPSDLMTGFENFERINPAICRLMPRVTCNTLSENTADKIHLYIAHYSESDVGVITSILDNLERLYATVYEYLEWAEAQSGAATHYLKLGYSQTPEIFDSVGTLQCLGVIAPNLTKNVQRADLDMTSAIQGHCSFCGKPFTTTCYPFDDARVMCPDCHEHITNDRKEVTILLKQAIQQMEKLYGITLPSGIRVRFKSASSFRDELRTNSRILGFYNLRRREIWVERGGPEPCVLSTLVHELTHAWQHANLDMDQIELKYIEGHSSYVEVEYLRAIRQGPYAIFTEKGLLAAQNEYGEGYRFWKQYLETESDKNIFHHMLKLFDAKR